MSNYIAVNDIQKKLDGTYIYTFNYKISICIFTVFFKILDKIISLKNINQF